MTEPGFPGAEPDHGLSRRGLSCAILAFGLPVILFLGGVIVVAGVWIPGGCGCASTPTPYAGGPTPTRWPVSASQAAAGAQTFTGLSMTATGNEFIPGTPVYVLTTGTTYAFVDGESGRMLEVFLLDQMPDADGASVTPDDARAAAQTYLDHAGVQLAGMTATVQLRHQVSVAFYAVVWKESGEVSRHQVLVNSSTGVLFAYADLGFAPKHGLAIPIVGAAQAARLAQASALSFGEAADNPPEFQIDGGASSTSAGIWTVGFNDGVLSVDAVTGQVSVLKWSSSR
jgi:hypothetical protein